MKKLHWGCAALVAAMLAGGCQKHESARERETELEENPPASGRTALDSAVLGTAIDTTGPLQVDSAKHMDAGASGGDTGRSSGSTRPTGTGGY